MDDQADYQDFVKELRQVYLNIVLINIIKAIASVDSETWKSHLEELKSDAESEVACVIDAFEKFVLISLQNEINLDSITKECPKEEL